MENSWQTKCGSMFQHSQLAASSLHESRTQFFNADHGLYLQCPQESMLLTHGMIQEHVVPHMPGFYNLGHVDCRDSFLLGPSAQVPCDLQHMANQKPISVSSQVSTNSRNLNGFAIGSSVSLLPGALWKQNMNCQIAKSGEVFFPLISSNSNAGNGSSLLQPANLNFQKSTMVCQNPHRNDIIKDFSMLIGKNNTGSITSNIGRLQNCADNTDSSRVPRDRIFSACNHAHTPSSSFPAVFCSGLSGNLLFSDTGLLGVVCSCHGLYMSISKFSEHSESTDVNPGTSVRMDNGETVAHWRKTFLDNSGIRILEGHREWDWPEGISIAYGLTKHPISNTLNDTVLLNPIGPNRTSVNYGQLQYSVINSKDSYSCGNAVDEFLFCQKERTSQECSSSLFKNLIDSCQGNLQIAAQRQIMEMSDSVGIRSVEKTSQSREAKVDSTCETESVLLAHPGIQNLKISCNGFSVDKNTSSIAEGLGVSSNIELRLGQPPDLSQALETLVAPGFESYLNGIHTEPQKALLSDRNLQKYKSRKLHWTKRTLQFDDITSNPRERRGPMQSDNSNHVGGTCGIDSFDGSVEMTSRSPLLFPCFKNPETDWQFRTTNDIGNGNYTVTEKLHCELLAAKCDRICFPWSAVPDDIKEYCTNVSIAQNHVSAVPGDIKEYCTNVSIAQNHINKGKEVEHAVNDLLDAAKSNFGFPNALKEDLSNLNAVLDVSSYNYFPAFYEKSPSAFQMSAMTADESHNRDTSKNSLKNYYLSDIQHFSCDPIRPIPTSIIAEEQLSLGLSSKSSALVHSMTSSSKKNGGRINPGFQDENVKMPAVQNLLESSIRDHFPPVGSFLDCEILSNPWEESLLTIASSISKDHSQVPDCFSTPKNSEVGVNPSGAICWMGNDGESFDTMTGQSLCSKDARRQCIFSCDFHPIQQHLVRPGENESTVTHSNKDQCFQGLPYVYVPDNCSCAFHENCLTGKCDLNGDNYCDLRKGADSANGMITGLFQPNLNENSIFLKEKVESFGKTGSLVAQNVQTIESHSIQWRDVPRNMMENCSLTENEQLANSFNCNGNLRSPVADVAKCYAKSSRHVVNLREHEISNASSGCSAPEVTQAFIEVDEKDSSTSDGGNIRCAKDLVMDEGSRIERSWSSDDALDNGHFTELSGSASTISLIKRRPFKTVCRKPSLGLIQELQLQNLSRSKNAPFHFQRSSTVKEESDHLQKFEVRCKKTKKAVKWMKLDASFPDSGQPSSNNESPNYTEEVGQNAYLVRDMQMQIGCEKGSPGNYVGSTEQSFKQRRSAFSACEGITLKRDLHRVHHLGVQATEAQKSSGVDDDNLEALELSRKKKLKFSSASATTKIFHHSSGNAEAIANFTSGDCLSRSLGKPVNFYKWMARPIVFGKYGIISNGNLSKPTKIHPMKKILKTALCNAKGGDRNTTYSCENYKVKSTLVKMKKTRVRHVEELPQNKKVLKLKMKKCVSQNVVSAELKSDYPDREAEAASCSETNESGNLSYTLEKSEICNKNYGVRKRKLRVQLKTKCKEARKRSLHELIITASKHSRELMKDAADGKVQTNEDAKRFSESHQLQNLLGFCCLCGSREKDKCNHLLDCNRCLIKGLLQIEAKAVDNGNAGFYGRCMHCAAPCQFISNCENFQPGEKLTCARTEGYKGRKREGFLYNHPLDSNGNAGCLVPPEQLNAWLHIHRQKPQRKGRPKLPSSNVQSDHRKAYACYKQLKCWKHLVVYKSGIHALGLYTSQFISHGAMVVEYVGEIVGLRVADQRESEYHSGKKLQYKSACYFFKIDKEHIIDATRKGGIARFVNHSCQPNCVAKVIAVRNEKKVVFLAERDIYPGEEITYDYNFNHEDEGDKIPCYCNSKNCRLYLN